MFRKLVGLVRLSMSPPSIIYPYPFLALLSFSLSGIFNLVSLFRAISISFLFYAGVNLWNHVNDIEEDVLAGRKTILTDDEKVRKIVVIISALLYIISFILSVFLIVDIKGIAAFAGAAFSTWIYSDRLLLGKVIKRWKNHYITEILAYVIFIPSFTSLLWALFTYLSLKSIAFSIFTTLFVLSGVFLKDIKDSSGDKLAGLRTLGAVFPPRDLLKASLATLGAYYVSIFIFSSIFRLLPTSCILAIFPILGLFYTLDYFLNNNWNVTLESIKPIKIMIYSSLLSLIILIIVPLYKL